MGAFSKKPYTAEVTQLREEDTSSGRYEGETDFAEEVLSSPKKLFVKVRMIKERDQTSVQWEQDQDRPHKSSFGSVCKKKRVEEGDCKTRGLEIEAIPLEAEEKLARFIQIRRFSETWKNGTLSSKSNGEDV